MIGAFPKIDHRNLRVWFSIRKPATRWIVPVLSLFGLLVIFLMPLEWLRGLTIPLPKSNLWSLLRAESKLVDLIDLAVKIVGSTALLFTLFQFLLSRRQSAADRLEKAVNTLLQFGPQGGLSSVHREAALVLLQSLFDQEPSMRQAIYRILDQYLQEFRFHEPRASFPHLAEMEDSESGRVSQPPDASANSLLQPPHPLSRSIHCFTELASRFDPPKSPILECLDLRGLYLPVSTASPMTFQNCDLRAAKFGPRPVLAKADEGASIPGSSGTNGEAAQSLTERPKLRIRFENCCIDGGRFGGWNLSATSFYRSSLVGTTFIDCTWPSGNVEESNLFLTRGLTKETADSPGFEKLYGYSGDGEKVYDYLKGQPELAAIVAQLRPLKIEVVQAAETEVSKEPTEPEFYSG